MNKHEKRQKSILPGGVGVKVVKTKQHPNGDIALALRSFKKEVKESGKMEEFKERRYYVPPSAKKREMMKRAIFFQWVEEQNKD